MTREELIVKANRVFAIRAEIQRVDELQQELAGLESEIDLALMGSPRLRINTGESSDDGLNERMVVLLDSQPETEFDADAIVMSLPDANIKSVRSGLSRLAGIRRITRPRRGKYQSLKGTLHALAS